MRIDPKLFVASVSSQTAQQAPEQPKRAKRNTGASVVSLSSAGAAVVAEPGATDESEPSARVEELKMMVEQGTYQVDLEALASRIVDDDIMRGSR